ncbi:MAG: DUF3887 domain-containing protein [Lachnospiraceae bacterium]|nr:DUF3887 domain-containing protein [Lachnospiraceae bacterium]
MKKSICMAMVMILAAFWLTGCSSTKLADGFDEATVKETVQKAVDHLIAGEYEECMEMMSQEMQEALTEEALAAAAGDVMAAAGEFQEYKSIAVVGQKDQSGADCAVAVAVASFENNKITYTVSFNADMEIIGFYMK